MCSRTRGKIGQALDQGLEEEKTWRNQEIKRIPHAEEYEARVELEEGQCR